MITHIHFPGVALLKVPVLCVTVCFPHQLIAIMIGLAVWARPGASQHGTDYSQQDSVSGKSN